MQCTLPRRCSGELRFPGPFFHFDGGGDLLKQGDHLFGIFPLFYHEADFLFGSVIQAHHKHGDARPQLPTTLSVDDWIQVRLISLISRYCSRGKYTACRLILYCSIRTPLFASVFGSETVCPSRYGVHAITFLLSFMFDDM